MSAVLFLNFYTANDLVHINVVPGTYLEEFGRSFTNLQRSILRKQPYFLNFLENKGLRLDKKLLNQSEHMC